MAFHWSLGDSNSPQVPRSFLNILADLNNTVVLMVSPRPPISKSSSLCINPLVTVPRAPIITGITVTFMFHSFFISLARSKYSSLFSFSFNFTLWSAGTAKSTICKFAFSCWLLQGKVVWSRLGDLFISQNLRGVCASHSSGQTLGCAYTICSSGRISISCTFPNESPYPPNRV